MTQYNQKEINQMQKDGVGIGYFIEDKQKFLVCGGCCEPFSLQMLPMLLDCGHFICSECYNNFKNTCIYCNSTKNVKIANYRKMFDYISSTMKSSITNQGKEKYSFSIRLNDHQAYTFNQMPGNMTFRTLFWKIEQFQYFQNQMKNKIRIFINSVGSIYEQIADMEIQKYNTYIQTKNRPNGSLISNGTRSNTISFHNRYLGGMIQQ